MNPPLPDPTPEIRTALHVRPLASPSDPVAFVDALEGRAYRWLLDSALVAPPLGRYSFAGAEPYAALRTFGATSLLETFRGVRPDLSSGIVRHEGDPLAFLRALLPPAPSLVSGDGGDALPFVGGVVGSFGYELACQLEDVALGGADDLGTPDQTLLFVDRLLAFDHTERRAFAVGLGFARADEPESVAAERAVAASEWTRDVARRHVCGASRSRAPARSPEGAAPGNKVESMFDESRYAAAVECVKRHIERGDVYQANLTHRMELPADEASPFELYRALRAANPAPFAAYLELPEVAILSSSPERFLRVDARFSARGGAAADGPRVESRPIKGTRPRGASAEEDEALARELAASEKDRAENLMIVDLVRNDLGRVCETGSVEVPELRAIERYATVFQMVSTVTGRLRADRDAIDLFTACFPPGSMTGAPKLAAMKLLDSIEPVRRGVYSGALGYLDVRGGLDLSVVIRTALIQNGRAYVHVGGAVVSDSDPVAEYRETLDKARVLLDVLGGIRDSEAPSVRSGATPGEPARVDARESVAKVW